MKQCFTFCLFLLMAVSAQAQEDPLSGELSKKQEEKLQQRVKQLELELLKEQHKIKAVHEEYERAVAASKEAQQEMMKKFEQVRQLEQRLQATAKEQGQKHAFTRALQNQIAEEMAKLMELKQSLGPQHPKVKQLTKQIQFKQDAVNKRGADAVDPTLVVEQIANDVQKLVATKEKFAADHPKVRSLEEAIRARKELAIKHGANVDAIDARVMVAMKSQLAALELELAKVKEQFSDDHPKVRAIKTQLSAIRDREKVMIDRTLAAIQKQVKQLHEAEKSLAKTSGETSVATEEIRRARQALETKLAMYARDSAKKNSEELLKARVTELQQMDRKLAEARERAIRTWRNQESGNSGNSDQLTRIEKKLERVANLLEKLVDEMSKKESGD